MGELSPHALKMARSSLSRMEPVRLPRRPSALPMTPPRLVVLRLVHKQTAASASTSPLRSTQHSDLAWLPNWTFKRLLAILAHTLRSGQVGVMAADVNASMAMLTIKNATIGFEMAIFCYFGGKTKVFVDFLEDWVTFFLCKVWDIKLHVIRYLKTISRGFLVLWLWERIVWFFFL